MRTHFGIPLTGEPPNTAWIEALEKEPPNSLQPSGMKGKVIRRSLFLPCSDSDSEEVELSLSSLVLMAYVLIRRGRSCRDVSGTGNSVLLFFLRLIEGLVDVDASSTLRFAGGGGGNSCTSCSTTISRFSSLAPTENQRQTRSCRPDGHNSETRKLRTYTMTTRRTMSPRRLELQSIM